MSTQATTPPATTEPTQPAPAPAPTPEPADQLRAGLDHSHQTLKAIKRERQITRALFEAGATDLDIAAAFIDRELAGHPHADPLALVKELTKRMPALFRAPAGSGGTGGSPPVEKPPQPRATPMTSRLNTPEDPRTTAADRARTTNSRTSLLTYMRLRAHPAD